ncbi:hypothetical protein BHE74_00018499 [Ensete ventricosum]|nr:hypothetical protein BHE74_00018499 [Ensete ventricosum]
MPMHGVLTSSNGDGRIPLTGRGRQGGRGGWARQDVPTQQETGAHLIAREVSDQRHKVELQTESRAASLRNDTMSRSQRRCKASLTTGQREVEYAMPEDKDLLQMSHPRAAQPRGRQPLSVVLRRICSTLSRSPYTPDRLMGLARGAPSSALLSASPTKLRGTCRRLCRGRTCHR